MENRIADQIRFYRKQKGLTQEQLAEAMGVSVAAVSKWEQGQSLPEIPMLMELADFFDLSVDALLGYRLRANDRKSIVERMKRLRREDNYDEGIAEAEKALQKFPNTFGVVYECAKLFEMAGLKRQDKKMQGRSLDLLSHAIRLLSQNSDPEISEMSLRLDMANVLLDMEDWERALALFKENNACGLLDDQIGCLLAGVKERREEGVPYLSWHCCARSRRSCACATVSPTCSRREETSDRPSTFRSGSIRCLQVSEKEIPSASLIRSARPRTQRSRGSSTTAVIWTASATISPAPRRWPPLTTLLPATVRRMSASMRAWKPSAFTAISAAARWTRRSTPLLMMAVRVSMNPSGKA